MANDFEIIDTETTRTTSRRQATQPSGLTGIWMRLGIVKNENQAKIGMIIIALLCGLLIIYNFSRLLDSPVPDGVELRSEPYSL